MAATKPTVKTVARSKIVVDSDLLPRNRLVQESDEPIDETFQRYIDLLREGHKFPPLDVFDLKPDATSDIGLYLVDGSYRLAAYDTLWFADDANLDKRHKVKVAIHEGTRADAKWFAAGANQGHGLPLTQAQRIRALEILLGEPEFAKKSDRAIGRQCGVDHKTVAAHRPDRQEVLPLGQSQGGEIPQGVPPVTEREEPGGACAAIAHGQERILSGQSADSAGAAGGRDIAPGAPDDRGSPPAPAEWPESIKDVILDATEALKHVASVCSLLRRNILTVQEVRRPGTCMFHAPAALARLTKLRRAIAQAIPYCVCPQCHGAEFFKDCPRCHGRGWLVRAETDETPPTPSQLDHLVARGVECVGISKAEAARRLDDLFAAETWQEREKHKANQASQAGYMSKAEASRYLDPEEDSSQWE